MTQAKREDLITFKWTPFWEETLEEHLIKHMFDFKAVCTEISKMINDQEEK